MKLKLVTYINYFNIIKTFGTPLKNNSMLLHFVKPSLKQKYQIHIKVAAL